MNLDLLSADELEEMLELVEAIDLRSRQDIRAGFYTDPRLGLDTSRALYPRHCEFFDSGREHKMRLFMAANRVGKTHAAAYELSYHLTGDYPEWWTGHRFSGCSEWWVCGVDSRLILSTLQPMLLGAVTEFGTGMIPDRFLDHATIKEAKKADTGVNVFRVRHITGSYSTVEFKSYESGRESFQGTARSIWLDEEPPLSVFTECLLRTATGNNRLMMTFTPLKGISETVLNFLDGTDFRSGTVGPGKSVTMASWDDVPHLTETDKAILMASIPPYQRDARTRGIPQLGSGAIYPVPESEYQVAAFEIPPHWKKYYGLDVGWNRTAAVWLAINPDTNVHYVYHEYYRAEAEPSIHVLGIQSPGKWIHGVIDTAARGRSQIDGENLMSMYRNLGLNIHDAEKSVETGLYRVWEALSTGRLKVFDSLPNFQKEIRMYRRDEKGRVIKSNDHLMDALRYAFMNGQDYARTEMASRRVLRPNAGLPESGHGWA
jgi:phage terminase large subunit-like protein